MKIELLVVGKSTIPYIKEGIDDYVKRLKHYVSFQIRYIDDIKGTKNLSEEQQKQLGGVV